MEFTITAHNGDSVKVEAENWMAAMGKAMAFFQVDIFDVGRLVCNPGDDGSIFIDNPSGARTWMVRMVEPRITVVAAPGSTNLAAQPVEEPEPTSEIELPEGTRPPTLEMPVVSSLHRAVEEKELLAERLFDVSMDLSFAAPEDACKIVLDLLVEYVPAQQISFAYGTINDPELKVLASAGKVAEQVQGGVVPFGEGLIGQCFEMNGTLVAQDVAAEDRHLDRLHAEAGYEARAAACVPIVDAEGQRYGVIQILDPTRGAFTAEELEAAEAVARTLGASFAEQ